MSKAVLLPHQAYDYESLEALEQKEEKLEPRLSIMGKTFKRALAMALSFTYSAELPILLAMLGRIQNNDGDNIKSLAAATLSITVLDTAIMVSISSTFAMIFEGGNIYGQMTQPETSEEQKIIFRNDISRMVKNSLFLASPFALPSMAVLFFSESILVNWFGQNREISSLAQQFLRPVASLIPLYTLRLCLQPIFFIHQRQQWMTIISLIGFFSFGVFLANGLGFGHFSLPEMGIQGIFLGVMSENIFTTLGIAACLFRQPFKDYHFSASFLHCEAEDWKQFKALAKQGIPLVITYLSELSTLFCKSIMAGRLGDDQLAAQNFSGQISFFVLFLAHAFSQATALGIGGTRGINKARFAQYGLLSGFLASLLPCIIVSGYPQMLTALLGGGGSVNDGVMTLAHVLIPLAAGTSVLYTLALTMLQSLRMTSHHVKPTIIFNGWLWLSVVSGYLLGFPAKLGVIGVGAGSLLGTGLGTAHLFLFWKREYRKPEEKNEDNKLLSIQNGSNALPPSSSTSEEDLPRMSSCWCTCFSRVMNRFQNWYNGSTRYNEYRRLNNFVS